jgi:hypothetical protein
MRATKNKPLKTFLITTTRSAEWIAAQHSQRRREWAAGATKPGGRRRTGEIRVRTAWRVPSLGTACGDATAEVLRPEDAGTRFRRGSRRRADVFR